MTPGEHSTWDRCDCTECDGGAMPQHTTEYKQAAFTFLLLFLHLVCVMLS